MACIVDKNDPRGGGEELRCSLCNERVHWTRPFIVWEPNPVDLPVIVICRACGPRIKDGLIADLVQQKAILDLKAAGHHDWTLDRRRESK